MTKWEVENKYICRTYVGISRNIEFSRNENLSKFKQNLFFGIVCGLFLCSYESVHIIVFGGATFYVYHLRLATWAPFIKYVRFMFIEAFTNLRNSIMGLYNYWTARTYKVNAIHNYSFLTTMAYRIRKHSDDKLQCIQICKKKKTHRKKPIHVQHWYLVCCLLFFGI